MREFTQITIEEMQPIEFLFDSDLETELHEDEDPSIGVHSGEVLAEMLREARCEGVYSGQSPLDFILSNGDTDTRFEEEYKPLWQPLESLCLCYHVMGNHEGAYFDRDGDKWREYLGYEETYYAWEYSSPEASITFIVLDTWCAREGDGRLRINDGSGNQAFREEEKEWLKRMLDRAPGLVVVFAHAHLWPPNRRSQDNEAIEELIDILKGTYEEGVAHRHAHVFFNGGHHDYPDCNQVDGVYFVDPIGAIHKGYARVIIDPIHKKMDYIGRFNERSHRKLYLTGIGCARVCCTRAFCL